MSNSLQHHELYNPWNSPSQNTGLDSISPSPGDLPNPGVESRSSALQADSSPAEPQGNSKNTGVGSLSLLQGIFPTQGSNPDLLHCRRILHQLSHRCVCVCVCIYIYIYMCVYIYIYIYLYIYIYIYIYTNSCYFNWVRH